MSSRVKWIWLAFIVTAISWLHIPRLGDFPVNAHAWSQSDRIALAYCFADNGMDLLHPCTYNFETKEGVTAVDLPIVEYIAAIPMWIFNFKSPLPLQLLQLLCVLLAFWTIRRFAKAIGLDEIGSEVIASFFLLIPVLAYFSPGSLPSVPALSFFILGLYHLFLFWEKQERSSVILASVFIALSILIRKPFVLHYAAILATIFFLHWKGKRKVQKNDLILFVPSLAFAAWFMWSKYLESEYGTAFLSVPRPIANLTDFIDTIKICFVKWRFDYLSAVQYSWIFLLFGANIWQQKGLKFRDEKLKQLGVFLGLSGVAYFFLMGLQFEHHDYYFLDAFTALIIVTIINYYPSFRDDFPLLKKWFGIFSLIAAIFWFFHARTLTNQRNQSGFWNRIEVTYDNFSGSESWLSDHKEAAESLLIPDAYTSNSPLLLSGSRGFVTLTTNDSTMDWLLRQDAQYMLVQDEYFLSDVLPYAKDLSNSFSFIAGNGAVSLYKRTNSRQTKLEFLGLGDAKSMNFGEFISKSDSSNQNVFKGNEEYGLNASVGSDRLYLKIGAITSTSKELYLVQKGSRSKYYSLKAGREILISSRGSMPMELYLWNPKKVDYEIEIAECSIR